VSPLLEVRDLAVRFRRGRRAPFTAVDGVSFAIEPGECVGLVGESGSGKTTIGRAILGLTPVAGGKICFQGRDIAHLKGKRRRALGVDLQVVFQNPYGSLNPARTIGDTLAEPLRVRRGLPRAQVGARVNEMLEHVGLPSDAARRYPAQFSGGQRQRIAIARALMMSPRLVICDEPVSSLDLSIQAQVLNLLRDLRDQLKVSYLFIAHDLAVVRHISQRIVVLYRGRIMESGPAEAVYAHPSHPYTRALLAAAPVADPQKQRARRLERLQLLVASKEASVFENCCPFLTRCPFAVDRCSVMPSLRPSGAGSEAACHQMEVLPPWNEASSEQPDRQASAANV
jgi:peptide/nickel transport system ATP-binding protein